MTYLWVIGGAVAAGIVPVLAFVGYKAVEARRREKISRKRRRQKITL